MQFADVERAALDTQECVEDSGYTAPEPDYDSDIYAFSFSIESPDANASQVLRSCIDERYQEISDLWQDANKSALESRDREIDRAVLACLNERGLEVEELSAETVERVESEVPGARQSCLVEALDSRS